MAKRKKTALSSNFDTARLDAIGPWTIETDSDNLEINWERPASIQTDWVPLNLWFHTDSGSPSYDPDERMFELYQIFVSRASEFTTQIRRLIPHLGEIRTATLVVYREGDEEDGEDSYSLSVNMTFVDDEHLVQADYDEDAQAFNSLYS
ncbi:MAG: hypothetical protein ACRC8S_15575 [Fimbriiglobus sp.]